MFSRLNSSPNHRTLLEFRAGKMHMIGSMVHPDLRKGLVYLTETDDNLIHFCWKDRNSGVTEDDLIIFPDDFEFKHVKQCTTGRVYVLMSKSTPERKFFWLQEPKTDRDDEFCYRVNEIMNGSAAMRNPNGNLEVINLNQVLNNMSPQQLIKLFTQLGRFEQTNLNQPRSIQSTVSSKREVPTPSTTDNSWPSTTTSKGSTGSTLTTNSRGSRNISENSQRILPKPKLENIPEIESSENVANDKEYGGNINFSMILINSEAIQKIISTPNIEKLVKYLPNVDVYDDSKDAKQKIKITLLSPDFQNTLTEFSLLFESGELGSLLKEFNLTAETMKTLTTGSIELFLKALEMKEDSSKKKM